MQQHLVVLSRGFWGVVFATAIGGCASLPFLSGGAPAPEETPPGGEPAPAPSDAAFPNPVVSPTPPPGPAALIPATDPDARLKAAAAGRVDPFGIPKIPIEVIPPKPKKSPAPAPGDPGAPGSPGGAPGSPGDLPPLPGNGNLVPPGTIGDLSPLPTFSPPDTAAAKSIAVTGVVRMGNKVRAIVKSPDESTSRQVTVGDRLVDGAVLVKRIDEYGGDPVVVFEQNGIEVRRAVGEAVEAPGDGVPDGQG